MRRIPVISAIIGATLVPLLLALFPLAAPGIAAASVTRPIERPAQHALLSAVPRAITSGPLTVTGTALTPYGGPAAGAQVEWGYYDDADDWIYGNTTTADAAGNFTFTGVPELARGSLDAYPSGSGDMWGMDAVFSTSTAAGAYIIAPGRVPFGNSNRTGVEYADIRVFTEGSKGYCRTIVTGQSAEVAAMPPDVTYATVRYRDRLNLSMGGTEWWAATIPVASARTSGGQIAVSEKSAHWMWVHSPVFASGPPGSKVRLILDNWAQPISARFHGDPGWPNGKTVNYGKMFRGTSTGQAGFVTLTVPKNAKPGYAFDFWATRSDSIPVAVTGGSSRLELSAGFEVCTLKARPKKVARNGRVTLSGVVPTQGHEGSTAGKRKTVTVFVRGKKAGQPTDWSAGRQGWKKVGTLRTNGLGAYAGRLRVLRTAWFVVRYPGDDWYYGGYTGLVKVTVR